MRIVLLALALVAAACHQNPPPLPPPDPGSLVHVTMSSQVGVLLDDFPEAMRDRVADAVLALPDEFWLERARSQMRLTSLRLVYRKYYFDEEEQPLKDALPLPPEERWDITLDTSGPSRETVDGHDLVLVDFAFDSMLLTDSVSPGVSDPALAAVGGVVDELFSFPIDPTLLLQRTGFACLSEDEFPAESVDAEDAGRFFDDTCEAEIFGAQSCHFTEPLPTESCIEALDRVVGKIDTALHFERVAWDDAVATKARFGEITTPDAPDLKVLTDGDGLNHNRIIYRYVAPGSCAVFDGCVGAPGWRRLLLFDSHDHNVGGQPLHIGPIDYFVEGLGGDLIEHNVYEFSSCHDHYHFQYYGDFSFGSGATTTVQKNGFCIESTDRLSNNELAPLTTEYICENQGVTPGWGDLYGASLTCNWVDITDVDTSAGPVTDALTFHSNPDGFLCEGTPVVDENGDQVFEPTEFTNSGGAVDRPVCEQTPGAEENDVGTVQVTVPVRGGFITQPCQSAQDLGPGRNCGFELDAALRTCTPGATTSLQCSGGSADAPMVLRVCDTSEVLGTAMDCAFQSARAQVVLDGGAAQTVSFECPQALDFTEPGGEVALLTAPAWAADDVVPVVCTP